jgi:hypothetical protein
MQKISSIVVSFLFILCLTFSGFAQENPFAPQKAPPLPAGMTGSNPNDPRSKLKPGMWDAGEAAFGIRHVTLLRKPDAFSLPNDPTDPRVNKTLAEMGRNPVSIPPPLKLVVAGLGFANSDIAFQGNRLFLGNFYGLNIYDIADPARTRLLASIICPGGQNDVSVYGNLLFMSVEAVNGRLDCGTQGFPMETQSGMPAASKERFRGVRIFDISNVTNPKQVAAVQTCRGSHTHTLVKDPKDRNNVYIYVSGTSFVRPAEELAGCVDEEPSTDPNTARFRIEVIKVPLKAPQQAKIVSAPRIFMDPRTGAIAGLMSAETHGTGKPTPTDQCHDITVYPKLGLAAGACDGNGILLDIRDPANPKRLDAVNDRNYAYWHSAAFSNDGKKVVFTDEWGGGMGARCRETDPNKWGANAIFNLANNKLTFASYYKMPAAQADSENCVAHNGSLIPVPGRDIKVQAWYQGGVSVMDFTDPSNPVEIAYFDRGPVDQNMLILAGHWSAYWYNGYIYGSEIARGLDVFELTPTQHLSQNEIDAARSVRTSELNVQAQEQFVWPNKLIVAKAYIDQLERSGAPADGVAKMRQAVEKAERSRLAARDRAELKKLAREATKSAAGADRSVTESMRLRALAAVLNNPSL